MLFMFYKVLFILSVTCLLDLIESESYLDTIVDSLEDLLKLCVKNERIIDINLLFGVTIVSGQLNFVEARNIAPITYRKLTDVRILCDVIFEIALRQNIANLNVDKTQQKLFSSKLWSFDIRPSHLEYHEDRNLFFNEIKHVKRHDLGNSSEFQMEYEICIRLLIEKCDISKQCVQLILNKNSAEYVLTHQVLYLLVLRQLILQNWCLIEDNAEIWLDKISLWLNDKCYQIYHNEFTQVSNNESQLLNNATLADLFIEQIVVCGLQSYEEFFRFKYIDVILKQTISVGNISRIMEKKCCHEHDDTEKILSEAHMISVRIAAMILYVKQMSRNQPSAIADIPYAK